MSETFKQILKKLKLFAYVGKMSVNCYVIASFEEFKKCVYGYIYIISWLSQLLELFDKYRLGHSTDATQLSLFFNTFHDFIRHFGACC